MTALEEGKPVEVTYTGRLVRLAPRERPRIALVRVGDSVKYVPLNDPTFTVCPVDDGLRAAVLNFLDQIDDADPVFTDAVPRRALDAVRAAVGRG